MLRALVLLTAFAFAAPLAAQESPDRTVRIVNNTGSPVNQLFGIASGGHHGLGARIKGVFADPDDAEDRLGSRTLAAHSSATVDFGNGSHRCRYDLKAVLQDGRTFMARDFDVCRQKKWLIASGEQVDA